jgi:sulfur carrier protein ThiS
LRPLKKLPDRNLGVADARHVQALRDAPGLSAPGGAQLDLAEGTTIQAVIERFSLPQEFCKLVLVDGRYIPPAERANRVLRDGETLSIWPPIAGG